MGKGRSFAMDRFPHSSAPLRKVKGIQFGIMDPDFLVSLLLIDNHQALHVFLTSFAQNKAQVCISRKKARMLSLFVAKVRI